MAREAFLPWSERPLEERQEFLLRLKELYIRHKEELAEIISRETGKPFWEAKTEAAAMAGKIDITIGHSLQHVKTVYEEKALPGVRGAVQFKPRGAMAVVGP